MSTPEDHFAALFWLECSLAAAHAAFCCYCFFLDGAQRASFDALGGLLFRIGDGRTAPGIYCCAGDACRAAFPGSF